MPNNSAFSSVHGVYGGCVSPLFLLVLWPVWRLTLPVYFSWQQHLAEERGGCPAVQMRNCTTFFVKFARTDSLVHRSVHSIFYACFLYVRTSTNFYEGLSKELMPHH